VTLDVVTGEIVPASVIGGQLTPLEVKERAEWLRSVTKAALTEGVDYGTIPGTERPTLLKPGAEMLLFAAGLGFGITKVDDEDARTHSGVTYRCTVRRPGGFVVAECDGYAGYDESRFYTSAEQAERKEREMAQKYKRPPRPTRMVEYRAPWNSLLKMAQKRALVGAALNAVAGSGLFTQDLEDDVVADEPAPREHPEPYSGRSPGPNEDEGACAVEGADQLVATLRGERERVQAAFGQWRRWQNYPMPPETPEQLAAMQTELAKIRAEEARDEPPVGSPID
jgi:hypothetical protein